METVEEKEADVEGLEVSFVPEDHFLIQVSFSVSHTTGDSEDSWQSATESLLDCTNRQVRSR